MPNSGDFDPAKAIQGVRQKQTEEQRRQAQEDQLRANHLELLCHAEKRVEAMHNPIVSEFVIDERWWTLESERISDKREPDEFRRTLRNNQRVASYEGETKLFRPTRYIYTIVTSHKHRSQTCHYGSWLSLSITRGAWSERQGLVKLRQPHAGYAFVRIGGWDPRTKDYIPINLTDHHGRKIHPSSTGSGRINQYFRLYKSLEPVIADSYLKDLSGTQLASVKHLASSLERLTKEVTQALDFVETGRPPEPKWITFEEPALGDH